MRLRSHARVNGVDCCLTLVRDSVPFEANVSSPVFGSAVTVKLVISCDVGAPALAEADLPFLPPISLLTLPHPVATAHGFAHPERDLHLLAHDGLSLDVDRV